MSKKKLSSAWDDYMESMLDELIETAGAEKRRVAHERDQLQRQLMKAQAKAHSRSSKPVVDDQS